MALKMGSTSSEPLKVPEKYLVLLGLSGIKVKPKGCFLRMCQ